MMYVCTVLEDGLTSQPACLLNGLVDYLQVVQEFHVVAAANLVACNQVSVEVVQLAITLLHSRPEHNGAYVQYV